MGKDIPILFDDDFLMVFDKPAGCLVIPSPKQSTNTLTELVNRLYHPARGRLHPCHRLDRETSGVIIYAKGKRLQGLMMELFHKRQVSKTYVAFVRGRLRQSRGHIQGAVQDYWNRRHHRRPSAKHTAKSAITDYYRVAAADAFSVVEVIPRTGRTNQIRIHFRKIGHPLLGERVYAYRKDFGMDFRRLALHAYQITFRHPVTHRPLRVVAGLPADMREFLRSFRNGAAVCRRFGPRGQRKFYRDP